MKQRTPEQIAADNEAAEAHFRAELPLDEQVRRVKLWQEAEFVHPLTCGTESSHPNLISHVEDGRLILICTQESCGYKQTRIPAIVLSDHIIQTQKKMEELRSAAQAGEQGLDPVPDSFLLASSQSYLTPDSFFVLTDLVDWPNKQKRNPLVTFF